MKSASHIFAIVFGLFLMISCSENLPNQHEQLYLDTADSLKLYKDLPTVQSQLGNDKMVEDYINLSFTEFKEKYDVDDKDVDLLSQSFQTALNISKVFQSIEDNMQEIESLEKMDTDSLKKGEYSFEKVRKRAFEPASDSSFETHILKAK